VPEAVESLAEDSLNISGGNPGNEDSRAPAQSAFSGRLIPLMEQAEPSAPARGLAPIMTDRMSAPPGAAPASKPTEDAELPVRAIEKPAATTNERSATPGQAAEKADSTSENRPSKQSGGQPSDSVHDAPPAPAGMPQAFERSHPVSDLRPRTNPAAVERESTWLETETPKPAAATHDIKLEVSSGEQRVELHLVDRGGDVHVDVRTPDTHLAGELRENLPTLSSRLEQSGLRPEEWHTSTPVTGEWHRQLDHSAGTNTSDPNSQPRQDTRERQDDPQHRPAKEVDEQAHRKQKGKEFAWYMSSLP